jgi:hypothetical protein
MPVTIDDDNLKRSIRDLSAIIGETAPIYLEIGRYLKGYVQQTIERGGRSEPWAPLSVWTSLRTGRTQPLITLAQGIDFGASENGVEVFFRSPSPAWNLTQHHEGYITRERWGRPVMVVPTQGFGKIFFRHAKQSVIPARPVWPTAEEITPMVSQMVADWIQKGAVSTWR